MKYIVKNCECKVKGKTTLCVRDIPYKKCENVSDCKIKQIVELCKSTCRKRCTNDCLGTRKHCGYGQILSLLEIEEINE